MLNGKKYGIGYFMNEFGQIDIGMYNNGVLTDFGKRIEKNGDSYTGNFVDGKIHFNSVISDTKEEALFCSMNLKNRFLHTPMKDQEFMEVP